MFASAFDPSSFDRTDPLSIFEYCRHLVGHSLRALLGDDIVSKNRKGKGALGQMVEELFFNYATNSCPDPDFAEAHVELKCTPVLKKKDGTFRIKERLVCTMIDYFELVDTTFEDSHLVEKCRLMLLLFYLHVYGMESYDYEFLFRVLWELPEKDLQLIKRDYKTIADKVKRGEAHLLSEGDTLYLGACRKGQKDDSLQSQPNSDEKAPKRAFCLKPAYMRYILSHVENTPEGAFTNFASPSAPKFELVTAQDVERESFEEIITERFAPFIGRTYPQICEMLGIEAYHSKSKYADVVSLIASDGKSKRLDKAEEFIKSGIILKTVRLQPNGMPRESMSFKNIDYAEVLENDDWVKSEAYEIFTSRFMFAVFKPIVGQTITIYNRPMGTYVTEPAYALDTVMFWTMPPQDLEMAHLYWQNIRRSVMSNHISTEYFWRISHHKKFHVRPKSKNTAAKTANPHGGLCDKYCYWFNAEYVKEILETERK